MTDLPQYLIFSDKIYEVTAQKATGGWAFDSDLINYKVEGSNPLSPSDNWTTRLGMSIEVQKDFIGSREAVPLEWILFRFLCHFVCTKSIRDLSANKWQVLTTTNYKDYCGHKLPDKEADQILRVVLRSWIRTFPQKTISLCDIYVSTDMTIDQLKRSINSLMSLQHIQETKEGLYKIKHDVFDEQVL